MTHRDQKVMVAYPHPEGRIEPRFHRSLVNLLVHDMAHHGRIVRGGAHLPVSSGAQITKTRNRIVRQFLDTPGIDWLWCVDTDMTFAPDTLDRLVKAAHPEKRPVVGGLCFSLMKGDELEVAPTLYGMGDGEPPMPYRILAYPPDRLVQVAATGAACLLVHRTVLEELERRWPRPFPWFAETVVGEDCVSEDITFCLRANAAGFPVHVDTGIRIGHVKSTEVDEESYAVAFSAWQARREPMMPTVPTYVVIPAKNRHGMTTRLVASLVDQCCGALVTDNGSDPPITGVPNVLSVPEANLSEQWNIGLEWAAKQAVGQERWNVAVLNNDLEVPPDFLARLSAGLRLDERNWIAYPNHHGLDLKDGEVAATQVDTLAGQTMSGWAFMLRGETGLRFDERFEFWYGDSDIERQVREADMHTVCVGGCHAEHLDPMRSTATDPAKLATARDDERRFAEKWNLDPASLWLAQHPTFGLDAA